MQQYFVNVFVQVAILFIMMAVGVVLGKVKSIDKNGVKQITNILITVVNFCVIVKAFASVNYSKDNLVSIGYATLALFITTVIGLLISIFAYKRTVDKKKAILQFGTIFSNCGFMAIPITQAIYGDEGVLIVSVYMAMFQITVWTLGIFLYMGKQNDTKEMITKILFNPGVLGVVVGMILFIFKIPLPSFIYTPIESLAAVNTPMAMIVTGYFLISFELRFKKSDRWIMASAFLRLLLIPAAVIAVLYLIGIRGFVLEACAIPICAPAASYTVMFAQRYEKDEVFAARLVSICTLLSLITMPLIISVTQIIA